MDRILFLAIILLGLVPASVFPQVYDTGPALSVILDNQSPPHQRSYDGRTVVIGEVINTGDSFISGVKILAGFFDKGGTQLEAKVGSSLLEVIPPNSRSPYVIESNERDAQIAYVDVSILGFEPSGAKAQGLAIKGPDVLYGTVYSGTITNSMGIVSEETRIHMVVYDAFRPPRLLASDTITLDQPLAPYSSAVFEFEPYTIHPATRFYITAESSQTLSNILDVEIAREMPPYERITIHGVSAGDHLGDKIPPVVAGSPVLIRSEIGIIESLAAQDYIYYTQVKESGTEVIQHIGMFKGRLSDLSRQVPVTEWIPQGPGLYSIEAFVWNPAGVPLAQQSPALSVLVV